MIYENGNPREGVVWRFHGLGAVKCHNRTCDPCNGRCVVCQAPGPLPPPYHDRCEKCAEKRKKAEAAKAERVTVSVPVKA